MDRQMDSWTNRQRNRCRAWDPIEINTKKSIVASLAPGRQVSGDLAMVCIRLRANHGTLPRGRIDGSEL